MAEGKLVLEATFHKTMSGVNMLEEHDAIRRDVEKEIDDRDPSGMRIGWDPLTDLPPMNDGQVDWPAVLEYVTAKLQSANAQFAWAEDGDVIYCYSDNKMACYFIGNVTLGGQPWAATVKTSQTVNVQLPIHATLIYYGPTPVWET